MNCLGIMDKYGQCPAFIHVVSKRSSHSCFCIVEQLKCFNVCDILAEVAG